MNTLRDLKVTIEEKTKNEGINTSYNENFGTFKLSTPFSSCPDLYTPFICIMAQGNKKLCVGEKEFNYGPGDYFVNLLPIPVEAEVKNISTENPMLLSFVTVDLMRLANIAVRIDLNENKEIEHNTDSISCIITGKADTNIITAFHRLTEAAFSKHNAEVLGDILIDEIYYRILTCEKGQHIRRLFNKQSNIYRIANAVNHIQNNLENKITSEELLEICNMSKTAFFDAFKEQMNITPLQYIKSSRLQKARILLTEGKSSNEVCYQVGYNSYSQFSREYKRFFGFSPSTIQDT